MEPNVTRNTPKKKHPRRRKIRSLIVQNQTKPESHNCSKLIIFSGFLLFIGFAIGSYSNHISIRWTDFWTSYQSQYNLLVHGKKDYCLPIINVDKLFTSIRKKVINQETALASIEDELKFWNFSKFIPLAVTGASGVGKSLFVHELMLNFPWKENIQADTWSTYNTIDHELQVMTFLKHFSDCGKNLIVIDNLEPNNLGFVKEYHKMLHDKIWEQLLGNLIVVYVFNIPTYTREQRDLYNAKIKELKELGDVKIVEFRKFDMKDVRDCIRHESRSLNLTLSDEDFEEISKIIDPKSSGCKNVYSKVLMYGNKRNL